jgi:hypothetical protein
MSNPWLVVTPLLGQNSVAKPTKSMVSTSPTPNPEKGSDTLIWQVSSATLLIGLIALIIYGKRQTDKLKKSLNFEDFKNKDLQKKLKLALVTIKKMETNPDLVHSREFNLDYLRMRMDEEVFHYVILNAIKIQISQIISVALRPNTDTTNIVGIVGGGRKIDETFDVTYELQTPEGKWKKRVLFRIQIKLTKIPTQPSSKTVEEIIQCIETYLSPKSEQENWQPAIQSHLVSLKWDQKAKPTPLLVMEQLEEGVNVNFRTDQNWHNSYSKQERDMSLNTFLKGKQGKQIENKE